MRILLTALLVLFTAIPALPQAITASLTGVVTDAQGAVIPAVKITLLHTETGQQWALTGDDRGVFRALTLPVGTYQLTAESAGFKKYFQSGIVLQVNEELRNDIRLEVGSVTESVLVTAAAELVNTNSASIQSTVDNKRMVELPLNGRNVFNLVYLMPGVGNNAFLTRSINGGRPEQESYQLDGGDFMVRSGNPSPNTYPPPDAVREFTLLANAFKAEHGMGGVVMNAITKSGTNTLHGSLWEFMRNDKLDARAFFGAKSKLRQNQFGGDIAGRVLRNKLFFYGLYDGFRNRGAASPTTAFVPTAAERQGDFSASSRRPIDPTTNSRFPNDRIPASRIDPIATRLLDPKIVPLPNLGADRFSFVVPGGTNRDQMLVKSDAILWSRQNLSVRFLKTYGTRGVSAGALPAFNRLTNNRPSQGVINWTWAQSATSINEFRFAVNRISNVSDPVPDVATRAELGFRFAADSDFFTEVNIPGLTRIGRFNGKAANVANTFQWLDNYSKIMGAHSLKVGIEITRLQYNFLSEFFSAGGFEFNGMFSQNPYADLLLGLPSIFTQNSVSTGTRRNTVYSLFVQDDFKASRKLTVNAGLRYDLQPWPTERDNKFGTFRPDRFWAGLRSKVYPSAPPGFVYIGDLGDSSASLFGGNRYNKWQPRVGFAYDVMGNGRMSIRGSYGIFFELFDPGRLAQVQSPPFILSKTIFAPTSFADPYAGQVNPFPFTPAANFDFTPLLPLSQRVPWADFTPAYHQHWNLSIEREIVNDLLLSVAYVANKGTHLTAFTETNPAVYLPGNDAQGRPLSTVANTNARRIYAPLIGSLSTDLSVGNNSYHSLQIMANKRFSNGYTVLSAYTWSHNIDDQSSAASAEGPQRPLDFRNERGHSFLDFRHRWVVSWVWELPKISGSLLLKTILNGWEVTGIHTLQSGNPINIRTGRDNSLTGVNQDRPNLVGNPYLSDDRPKGDKLARWINIDAFQTSPLGTFGNLGRNVIFGPGLWNLDLGVFRNIAVTERSRFQFRWELFDALNHPNFRAPNSWLLSAPTSFGRISSTTSSPRVMQFGLKYQF